MKTKDEIKDEKIRNVIDSYKRRLLGPNTALNLIERIVDGEF